jgi:hypothetical protein
MYVLMFTDALLLRDSRRPKVCFKFGTHTRHVGCALYSFFWYLTGGKELLGTFGVFTLR